MAIKNEEETFTKGLEMATMHCTAGWKERANCFSKAKKKLGKK